MQIFTHEIDEDEPHGSTFHCEAGEAMAKFMGFFLRPEDVRVERLIPNEVVIRHRSSRATTIYTYTGNPMRIRSLIVMVGLFAKAHPECCSQEALAFAPTTLEEYNLVAGIIS